MNSLKDFIDIYRNKKVWMNLKIRIIVFFLIFLLFSFFFLTLESILYLEVSSRIRVFIFMLFVVLIGSLYIGVKFFFESKGKITSYSEEYLSNEIGKNNDDIMDKLKNSIQLQKENYKNPITAALSSMAIQNMLKKLDKYIYPNFTIQVTRNLKTVSMLAIPILIISIYYHNNYISASERLINPTIEYSVPLPFTLTDNTISKKILEGDSLLISISSEGLYPDSLDIIWEFNKQNFKKRVGGENGYFSTIIYNITDDITYSGLYETKNLISPWNKILTKNETIEVIKRPKIINLDFEVTPPKYTNKNTEKLKSNSTDISIIEGSQIQINALSNKNISNAWINDNGINTYLNYNKNNFSGFIDIDTSSMISIHCKDTDNIDNINPPSYKINIIPDKTPIMYVTNPPQDFVITEKREIDFEIQVIDDYGFSDAWIEYRIIVPSYLNQDTSTYIHTIPEINRNLKAQQFIHKWSFDHIALGLDDKLEFYVYIADNNNITGPGIARSNLFTGSVPSLEDMFMELENKEEEIKESAEEITLSINEVEDLVDDLKMELLKSEDEVEWEQTKKIEESINKMDEVFKEIEKIQDTMQEIQEKAEENQIMDESLLDKFSLFQEMLNEIMTPEMLEALQNLKEKMENMNTDQMLQALQNLEFDLSLMEQELDRFIEMFERAMAEQALEKLVQQLSEMIDNQLIITDELNSDIKPENLSSKQEEQKQRMNKVKENIGENTDNISKFSESSGNKLQELLNSELTNKTEKNIHDTKKYMNNGEKENSLKKSEESLMGLEEMLEESLSIQEQFLNETVDKMSKEFLSVATSILSIAKLQESIYGSLDGVRSNSPKLRDVAKKQNVVQYELYQIIEQILNLSTQTFHITPKINRSIGFVQSAIQKTINNLEQKKVTKAKQEQKKVLVGINKTAYLILSSLKNMQQSMSSSGFSSYMEALSEMSGQQQGINQGTMQLSQMGLLGQDAMMERLQAQQQELQKQLGELMSEFPEQGSGSLSKANEEMNEVIRDFIERKVNEETLNNQQKILSRMLDSQKSLTERDFSNKRKSKSGEEKDYTGPLSLPNDKGERKTLLTRALQEAMDEGYSEEYQTLLKIYFKRLENIEQ